MSREKLPLSLGRAAFWAVQAAWKAQPLKEQQTRRLVRGDFLDLGEGDVVWGAFYGSMRHGRVILATPSNPEDLNTTFWG
tara:strand:+ start:90 stop:329 length:240 start_codon:yes stop_codon:yes gene_type:complete